MVTGPDPPASDLSAGLPYRQPLNTRSAVNSARAECSLAGFESRAASTKSVPCGVGHSPPSKQWELPERASNFTCQFVEGPVADRYARVQTCGVAMADQRGRRRHRGWRTTPKVPQAGKTQVAAIAMP